MKVLDKIYRYEFSEQQEVLLATAEKIDFTYELSKVIPKMFELMHSAHGVGLAAPQVGISKRFFIVELSDSSPLVFVNPQILSIGNQFSKREEGCLSMPGLYTSVTRPSSIEISAHNVNFEPFVLKADGLLATVIQHELDHLDGILFIDRIDSRERSKLLKRYKNNIK